MKNIITPKQVAEAVAITDTARFWIGRGDAGRVIFDREPNPADYPGMTIAEYRCTEVATAPALPAAAQPVALVPKWAGEFANFQDWVNRAQRALRQQWRDRDPDDHHCDGGDRPADLGGRLGRDPDDHRCDSDDDRQQQPLGEPDDA